MSRKDFLLSYISSDVFFCSLLMLNNGARSPTISGRIRKCNQATYARDKIILVVTCEGRVVLFGSVVLFNCFITRRPLVLTLSLRRQLRLSKSRRKRRTSRINGTTRRGSPSLISLLVSTTVFTELLIL